VITLKVVEVTRFTIRIRWTWDDDQGTGNRPTGYKLSRGKLGDPLEWIAFLPGKGYVDYDLDPATDYVYSIETQGLPTPEVDQFQLTTEPATEFTDSVDFFAHFVSGHFGRKFAGSDIQWCPEWWRHQEASTVINELWRSYEAHRPPDDPTEPTNERAEWLVMFAYPLMQHLFALNGTFRGCIGNIDSGDFGHRNPQASQPLPHIIDPTGNYQPD
jgi:hypothetical protein